MAVRSLYIPPVNTVPHGRSLCIPPVNTVPHGNHTTVHSSSQHSTTWQSGHCAFHQSTQYHMAARLLYIPPVNTAPHGRSLYIPPVNTVLHGSQITVHSTSQHSTTWRSDHCTFHQSTQYHMAVRSLYSLSQSTQYHMAVRLKACQKEVGLGVQQRTLLKDVQKKDCWKNNWRDYSRKTAGERHAKERLLKKDYWRMTAEKKKRLFKKEWWRKMCWKKTAEEGLVKKVCWNQTKRRGVLPVQAAGDTVPACRPSALSPDSGQHRLAPAGRRRSSQAAPGLFLVTRVASGTAAGTAMQAHSQQFIIRLITTTHSTWG